MPILSICTNQQLDDEKKNALLHKATDVLSGMLDKPKGSIMVKINSGVALMLGDTMDPVAHVKLKLFAFDKQLAPKYVTVITEFITSELGVPADRQFQQLIDMAPDMFGYNGSTC